MTKCTQLENLLTAYALDELGEQDRQAVEKHLADCAQCRNEVSAMQSVLTIADSMKIEITSEQICAEAALDLQEITMTAAEYTPSRKSTVKLYGFKFAAAMIIFAALAGIYLITGSIDGASVAFADVIDAMKNVAWLHQTSKGFEGSAAGTAEQWLGFNAKIFAAKWVDGKKTFWDMNEQKKYEYDPEKNHITIEDTAGTELPFSIASPTKMLEGMHKMLVEQGAEGSVGPAKYDGRNVQLHQFSLSLKEQSQLLKLYIDPKSKLLIAARITAKDATDRVLMDGSATFSYPNAGPASIYDLGVPKDTPIVPNSDSDQTNPDTKVAVAHIDQADSWPEPTELVQQYWNARNRKDYITTRLYWPGSEQWDKEIYEKESPVEYVCGVPKRISDVDLYVPYDTKEHYEQTEKYRFKMILSRLYSQRERYYIMSGN